MNRLHLLYPLIIATVQHSYLFVVAIHDPMHGEGRATQEAKAEIAADLFESKAEKRSLLYQRSYRANQG